MMRVFSVFILLMLSCAARASTPIRVGMFYGANHVRASFSVLKGSYSVQSESNELFIISAGKTLDISASGGKVNVAFEGKNYPGNTKIQFKQTVLSEFKATPAGHKPSGRIYQYNMLALAHSG